MVVRISFLTRLLLSAPILLRISFQVRGLAYYCIPRGKLLRRICFAHRIELWKFVHGLRVVTRVLTRVLSVGMNDHHFGAYRGDRRRRRLQTVDGNRNVRLSGSDSEYGVALRRMDEPSLKVRAPRDPLVIRDAAFHHRWYSTNILVYVTSMRPPNK